MLKGERLVGTLGRAADSDQAAELRYFGVSRRGSLSFYPSALALCRSFPERPSALEGLCLVSLKRTGLESAS